MAFRKILVAHDLSEPANRALVYAAGLAKTLGAELYVVHVLADIYDGRGEAATSIPWITGDQTERYVHFLTDELQRTVKQLLPDQASIEVEVVRGDPVKRIEAYIKEIGADMVCVASTGKGAVQRALLGSVSQGLLRSSEVPVLSVH